LLSASAIDAIAELRSAVGSASTGPAASPPRRRAAPATAKPPPPKAGPPRRRRARRRVHHHRAHRARQARQARRAHRIAAQCVVAAEAVLRKSKAAGSAESTTPKAARSAMPKPSPGRVWTSCVTLPFTRNDSFAPPASTRPGWERKRRFRLRQRVLLQGQIVESAVIGRRIGRCCRLSAASRAAAPTRAAPSRATAASTAPAGSRGRSAAEADAAGPMPPEYLQPDRVLPAVCWMTQRAPPEPSPPVRPRPEAVLRAVAVEDRR